MPGLCDAAVGQASTAGHSPTLAGSDAPMTRILRLANQADQFLWHWNRAYPADLLIREYRFNEIRRWRFDCAEPVARVAVEIDGGTWVAGRHTRGAGFERDCEKLNAAVADGWAVFRFTTSMLQRDPLGCCEQVARMIRWRTNPAAVED